ncbi:GerAB/ArcD/ProY family transporter [Paenibacillus sp. DMB20]|uniref:GerAB/ArcD/ProY family transporter n=1 Tax=Paenibacillus sp. DMB20 TaxID=1642570 RepID=UPI001F2BE14C|nr:GerAB/ArcD/ProY family transporter [Paenibacillus sp. DMB20]
MLVYVFVTIICFVFYSPDGITVVNQPGLSFLKTIEFRFLERFDMVFLAVYLILVSKAWNTYAYVSAFSTGRILNKQDHSSYAFIYFLLVIGCVFFVNPTWNLSEKWTTLVSYIGMAVIYVFPLFLLVFALGHEKYRRWKAG